MNFLTGKPTVTRTWRWAKIGAYLCFVLASLLMLASLRGPDAKSEPDTSAAVGTAIVDPQG